MTPPQTKPDHTAGAVPDEAAVERFLIEHPEFFDRHQSLLATLRLPHQRGDGATVSLLERQMDILRERSRETELRLRTLLENGHANDVLAEKIHRLALRLIAVDTPAGRLGVIESSLRDDFGAAEFVLVLYHVPTGLGGSEPRDLRVIDRDHADLKSFDLLFSSGKPRCGRVRDSQREFLFPASHEAVGSVALVPLGPHGGLGLLAIASPDVDHFNPTMSTDFLARIGELVATALHGTATHGGA
jgi:hypothetical protein